MALAIDHVTVHARSATGVSRATFSFDRGDETLGHAVRGEAAHGQVLWHVTDRVAAPFVVEARSTAAGGGWLLSRPDGVPFARIDIVGEEPLELEVLDGQRHLVRLRADGTLLADDGGTPIGAIDLAGARPGTPDGVELDLPAEGDPVLRAAILTIPLCLVTDDIESDTDRTLPRGYGR